MGDHSVDLQIKAVNEGTVVVSSSKNYSVGQHLIYYPFSPNKVTIDEKNYHVIHERDVMGIVETKVG